MALLLAAPVIELGFVPTEFTSSCSNTDTFCKLQGFAAKFRRMLLTWFLLVDTDFVMSHLW